MDNRQQSHFHQSFETAQNLSFKGQDNSLQDRHLEAGFGNENYENLSEFPIYCMSDASGRLHFNLSIFPESTLNPTEQQNLGRQLPEYIRDHYDKYKRNSDNTLIANFSSERSDQLNPHSQALYDDFRTHNPAFSLSPQTYIKALKHLSSSRIKTLSRSPAQFLQKDFSDCHLSGQETQPTPYHNLDPSNSCAYSVTESFDSMPVNEKKEWQGRGQKSERYEEKEAMFFNRLNICRRKENILSVDDNSLPKSPVPTKCHQSTHKTSFTPSNQTQGREKCLQNIHPSPLPQRCSCPAERCFNFFDENERQQICKRFWCGKTHKGKHIKWTGASIQKHILHNFKWQTLWKQGSFFIGKYFLHKLSNGRQKVCRHYFLTTLGLYISFPLLDILRRRSQHHFQQKHKLSSPLKGNKKKIKKKSVKHYMKRHARSYFSRHFSHERMAASSIEASARKSFIRFSNQFPHLLDSKSFEKYMTVIHKMKCFQKQHHGGITTSSSRALPHKSGCKLPPNSAEMNHSLNSASSSISSLNANVMKIKAEDIDEVIADDIAKKNKRATNSKYRVVNSYYNDKKQTLSPASTITANMGENSSGQQQHPLNENNATLLISQLCQGSLADEKRTQAVYTKMKKNSKQKKNKKNDGFRKLSSKKGIVPHSTEEPKKRYKLAVNEIEGDQSKHPILPPCNCIKSKCASKVPEEQRKAIHSHFWNLDNIARRGWMVKHVHILKPKSRSNRATARLHQMHRKFFLPDACGELHDVCKKFFLGTLGFKGTGVLRPQNIPGYKNSSPEKEPRKRVLSYQVCRQDVVSIIEYCQSFNREKDVAFCGDEKFTNTISNVTNDPGQKICVPYGFTWKELYRDYCAKKPHIEFGYQTFRSILSLVEHNNFSVNLLEKFKNFDPSDPSENSVSEFCQNVDSEVSSSTLQEQYHLLQSFPSIPKVPKKTIKIKELPKIKFKEREPLKDVVVEEERKPKKSRKKLKLSKSFFTPDFNETVKCYKTRNSSNTRYNFREGVPLVSYSFDMDLDLQNLEQFGSDGDEGDDIVSDDIKEETKSDFEKNKKPVKHTTGKRPGRPPKKHKTKCKIKAFKAAPVDVDTDEDVKSATKTKTTKPVIKKRGRKKTWKLKIDMKQRESTIRLKNRHPILPPCKCNYRKCHEKISEQQRENIHNLYWSISSKQERIRWVLEHIRRCSPKSRSNTNLPSRKRETRRYFLPNEDNEVIEVCRIFFLRTLGYHWDSVVDSVSRTLPRPGGYLAKSLGFAEEQLPYEVIVQIKTFLKRKKIRKSSVSADQFPDESQTGESEDKQEEENVTLEGYSLKNLFNEFEDLHPEHKLDFRGFKQIVRFILVPGSEAQTEWEMKQEQLQNANSENGMGNEAQKPETGLPDNTVYFTPEFEKIDLEKALIRKARRRRPLSSRNSKDQHPMREPCNCARKCREKIDQRKREEIHQEYWSLITYNQRKQWILEHIKREAPKRRTNPNGPIKKMETRKFYFEDWSGTKVEICKGFFLSTLGFKWDKMVDTICKTTPRHGQFVRPDQRGKKPPSHKLSESLISSVTTYIETILETASCVYPKTPSKPQTTGKPKKTPDRMPYGLTMKNLFEDYKIKHPNHKVGYESFRKIYRSVIHSEKHQQSMASPPQDHDEEDEPEINHLPRTHQPPMANMPLLSANVDSSSADGADDHNMPSFESVQPSCMYKNLHAPDQTHITTYQRQCEPTIMKPFSEGINSFSKPHDVQFYPQNIEQNEEMSMQMYKSICLPATNPNQPYAFYPNSLPLDAFSMSSSSQGIHGGLPYSDSLRHSDLMHHHPYQPPHPHFSQGRFHGFVLPSSAPKEPEPNHHQHVEMNVGHNYREDFNCNPYPGKNPLVYPPAYHNTDNMPSSSNQRHSFDNLSMQTPAMHHDMRGRDASSTPTNNLLEKSFVNNASPNNCHVVPNSIPAASNHPHNSNEWTSHLVSPTSKVPPLENDLSKKNVAKRPKGRPAKKAPKEKLPKVKKVKKVRPKSKRNTREFNPMLPPCKCTVKKCLEKIPEPRRKEIYDIFWDLGCYNTRKQWIAENIVREDPKRRTSLDNPLRRMETRRFFLPNSEGERMEVCKGFFLRTLGFKWDKMVDTICKTTEKGQCTVRPDMRGKRGPSHKLKEEVASSVESYARSILQAARPAYEGHVEQSETHSDDKDIFVPYGLTMKNFHEDYKGKHAHHKVGYESFRKIFRRVSKEVLDNASVQEDDKSTILQTPSKDSNDVISPVTGLPQQAT